MVILEDFLAAENGGIDILNLPLDEAKYYRLSISRGFRVFRV